MKKFICYICGHIHEGLEADKKCARCNLSISKLIELSDAGLIFPDEHRIGGFYC